MRRISKGQFGKLSRRLSTASSQIILLYHGIQADHPLCVMPERFLQQMAYVKDNFGPVPLDRVLDGHSSAQRSVVAITFDDAYSNLQWTAFPVLAKLGLPATVYIPAGFIGKQNEWDSNRPEALLPILNVGELREMCSLGISVGSHTHTHTCLRGLGVDALRREIVDSKRVLEDLLDVPVDSFAYPYGSRADFDQSAVRIVREAGYNSAVTTWFGRHNSQQDRYVLRRIIVSPNDTLSDFILKVSGDYDWVVAKEALAHLIRRPIMKIMKRA